MLLGHPWLKDAKISHDWGTNNVIIRGTNIIRTIHITKKLGVQTKKLRLVYIFLETFTTYAQHESLKQVTLLFEQVALIAQTWP
jgi:hypothetical protein